MKKGGWRSGVEALQKKMNEHGPFKGRIIWKRKGKGIPKVVGNEEPPSRDEGCNGRDKPKSSLSLSTDPASDRASESLIGSKAITRRPVFVSTRGLIAASITGEDHLS